MELYRIFWKNYGLIIFIMMIWLFDYYSYIENNCKKFNIHICKNWEDSYVYIIIIIYLNYIYIYFHEINTLIIYIYNLFHKNIFALYIDRCAWNALNLIIQNDIFTIFQDVKTYMLLIFINITKELNNKLNSTSKYYCFCHMQQIKFKYYNLNF